MQITTIIILAINIPCYEVILSFYKKKKILNFHPPLNMEHVEKKTGFHWYGIFILFTTIRANKKKFSSSVVNRNLS